MKVEGDVIYSHAIKVLDPETLQPVPADGQTLGEVMFR